MLEIGCFGIAGKHSRHRQFGLQPGANSQNRDSLSISEADQHPATQSFNEGQNSAKRDKGRPMSKQRSPGADAKDPYLDSFGRLTASVT
jgi:hypothetical protein